MRQGVKTELKEGKLCGMEDRGRGTLWKGMKKQTRSKQMRSESPEKLPALTGGSEALERGQKLLSSNPPLKYISITAKGKRAMLLKTSKQWIVDSNNW